MDRLCVIIPFLNEGDEVRATLESLRATSGSEVDVYLVDDASTDGYDYRRAASDFGAHYVRHDVRRGVAASRDEAIARCASDFFVLLDAHMRFTSTTWSGQLLDALRADRRAIWCGQTAVMWKDAEGHIIRPRRRTTYGAFIDFDMASWHAWWNYRDPAPGSDTADIPVVLGAVYATNKDYWARLGGLSGLRTYGMDEQLISTKAWLEGGRCRLLKNVVVEHLYRKHFPYPMDDYPTVYNSLLLSELFLEGEMQERFMDSLIRRKRRDTVVRAMEDIVALEAEIETQKQRLRAIQAQPFEAFVALNRKGENDKRKGRKC